MKRDDKLKLDMRSFGVYVGPKMCDLLLIVNFKNKNEIREFVEHKTNSPIYSPLFMGKKIEEVIPFFEDLPLEECKDSLFKAYQNLLIDYLSKNELSELDKLNNRLINAGIDVENIKVIDGYFMSGDFASLGNYIKELKDANFLKEFLNTSLDEYEGEKSVTYDEVKLLNNELIGNPAINTIVGSGGHTRSTHKFDGTSYYLDSYKLDKDIEYCKMANCNYRYHALIDYKTALDFAEKHMTKEQVLENLRSSIIDSFNYINIVNSNKEHPGIINCVEIFNELVEYNKEEKKDYQMIWQKYFGITTEDLIHLFDGIKKPEGVTFMYNETMLEESEDRLKVVENLYKEIQTKSSELNGQRLIDIFGNQMHLEQVHGMSSFEEGSKKEELRSSLELMKRIQEGYPDEGILPAKIEITEFDIHASANPMAKAMQMMKEATSQEEIDYVYSLLTSSKKQWVENVSNLIKAEDLKLNNITYWSLLDNVDHNLARTNKETNKFGFTMPTVLGGLYGDFDKALSIKKFADLIDSNALANYIAYVNGEKIEQNPEQTENVETPVEQVNNEPDLQTEIPTEEVQGPVRSMKAKRKHEHGLIDPMTLITIILAAISALMYTIFFKMIGR